MLDSTIEKKRTMGYPYIVSVKNHWFRDLVFKDDNSEIDCYETSEPVERIISEEWWKAGEGQVESITDFAMDDLDKHLKVYYSFSSGIKQTKLPYYVDKCPQIIELINKNKYHIFKGMYSNSEDIEEAKQNVDPNNLPYYTDKRNINWLSSINSGIQLLQEVETEQAEYNLRDLKEILAYYNFDLEEESEYSQATDKEALAEMIEKENMYKDWRNRVRGWVILDGEGNVIEKGENSQVKPNEYGTDDWSKYINRGIIEDVEDYIPTANTSTLDDLSMNIAARSIGSTGFNYGENVCSTCNGEVVAVDDNTITIKSDEGNLIHISNISTNANMKIGDVVYVGQQIATTTEKDINVILRDKYHNTLDAQKYIDTSVLIDQFA